MAHTVPSGALASKHLLTINLDRCASGFGFGIDLIARFARLARSLL